MRETPEDTARRRKTLASPWLIATVAIVGVAILGYVFLFPKPKQMVVRYAISPYQDTALPVVAETNGWYKQEGLNVELKLLDWGNVMDSVASGAVDVAIQNFNSFQPVYFNINTRGGDVVFYYPLYVFKGAAIMVKQDKGLKPLDEFLKDPSLSKEEALRATVLQLKGKRIITTKGTEMEQVVLAALEKAGLKPDVDVKIINSSPADGLRAFIAGDADAYSGGLTERTEARRHGSIELLTSAAVTAPVIDGLVTTKHFAAEHPEELNKLIKLWFKTITWMEEDLDTRSKIVIEYLAAKGSTRYSVDEYKYAWQYAQVFPRNPDDLQKAILQENAQFFWQKSWDANNQFLLKENKIPKPVPYDGFVGDSVQTKLQPAAK